MSRKSYRRLYLKLGKTWYAQIWQPPGRWKNQPLFPLRDSRAIAPDSAQTLRSAWQKIATGKIPSKEEALQRVLELCEAACSSLATGSSTSLRELAGREKASSGAVKGRRRALSTRIEIRRTLDTFVEWVEQTYPHLCLFEMRRPLMEEYVTLLESKHAAGTVRNRVAYIRRMFELGVELELIPTNPCRKIQITKPSVQEEQRAVREYALSSDETSCLLEACRAPYTTGSFRFTPPDPLVLLLLRTGCRIGELVRTVQKDPATGEREVREGLLWENIVWDEHYILVDGKTGPRAVPVISDDALDALREYHEKSGVTRGPVFRDSKGDSVGSPDTSFAAAVKRAGIIRHVRIHDLRHTVGTQLEKNGVRQRAIQVQLAIAPT